MTTVHTEAELDQWLREAIAGILGVAADTVDPERPLTDLGIGSRDAVGLVGELEDYLDRDLDATLVWKTPTIAALARFLAGGEAATDPGPPGPAAAGHDDGEDAVAIVGLGCRFPGGIHGPQAFWEFLRAGGDALGEVPEGRWEQFTGPSAAAQRAVARTTRRGGYLDDVAHFDADYFGISPREAQFMDPQQRMLLEVAIEALEHAGIPVDSLRGSDTGVFVGMSGNEYGYLTMGDPGRVDAWTATGAALAIASNRISYLLDLRGPSFTLDTACSSSLVALHQAARSIAAGEITTALVGGVNLLLSPSVTMTFDQAGALAASGGCKPFSADADGIARAEGCGVVVVKRLSAALADGDRVLAVVRGTAVNSDGRSNGITAPNPDAQQAVLRAAYTGAGIDPATVDYVEAHGTGTLLGDPIEASALGAVLGSGRPAAAPLGIGSVKSNLGHLEAAAGIAGLIKVVLGVTHGVIPPSLHFSEPNPHIRFDDWGLEVVTAERAWPRYGGVARAGVSGFGFGGTNAHAVVEEWPAPPGPADAAHERADDAVALLVTGASQDRVRATSGALAEWLTGPGESVPLPDAAHTLARRRARGAVRTVVAARGRAELAAALRRHAEDAPPNPAVAAVLPEVPRVTPLAPMGWRTPGAVWVFSGTGSQWSGMGRRLLLDEPAFGAAIDEMDGHIQAEAGFSLRKLIEAGDPVRGVARIQVAVFGLQLGLAALWRSYGAEPAAVIGNSMGEVTAAVVAGALDLSDGVRLMAVRSRLLEDIEHDSPGGMAVIELSAEELARVKDRFPDIHICVYASPSTLTVGTLDDGQRQALLEYVESLGRNAWPVKIRGMAHTYTVEQIFPELVARIGGLTPRTPTVPFYSTVFTDPREQPAFDIEYWKANVRLPVRFAQAVAAAAADGHPAFVEVSPHPIAVTPIRQSAAGHARSEPLVLSTLRRETDDTVTFRANALALHAAGLLPADVVVPATRQADLPPPAWQRKRFWVDGAPTGAAAPAGHPLLGVDVDLPEGDRQVWRGDAGTQVVPWLADHQVFGVPVLPVAGYAEMALTAGRHALAPGEGPASVSLAELELLSVMVLGEHTEVTTTVTRQDGSTEAASGTAVGSTEAASGTAARVDVYARPPGAGRDVPMTRHATATVRRAAQPCAVPLDLPDPAAVSGTPVELYAQMRRLGHTTRPSFAGVSDARVSGDGVAAARVTVPDVVAPHAAYGVHPVLLDVCLQVLGVSALHLAASVEDAASRLYMPVGIGEVRVLMDDVTARRDGSVVARLRAMDDAGEGLSGDLRLVGADGAALLEIRDVYLRRINRDEVPDAPAALAGAGGAGTVIEDDDWAGVEALRLESPATGRQLLLDRLRARLAWVMGHRPEDVDVTVPLASIGVDSLMAVRAKNAVEHDVGVTLPVRLLLQGASLADLEAHLAGELGIAVGPAPTAAPPAGPATGYVEARDATERWLTTAWERALGHSRPGVRTSLTGLGADDAARREVLRLVRARLAAQPGAGDDVHGPLDDGAFLAADTIEAGSDLIRDRLEAGSDSPLRVLRPGEPGHLPVFVFHPAGGTTSVYFSLASQLDPRTPVYGFERVDEPTVGGKVARYVELIRQIQPHGPYRLGGWSFGGVLAYEAARRFREHGEEVPTLFMIDVILPRQDGTDERAMLRGRYERFLVHLRETYGVQLDVDLDELAELPEEQQMAAMLAAFAGSGVELSPALLEHQRTSYEDARTAERFEPQPYEWPVVLYRATERGLQTTLDPRYARTEDALGWDMYCPSLEVVKIPGDHTSLIDPPHVDALAQHLRQVLSEVVHHG